MNLFRKRKARDRDINPEEFLHHLVGVAVHGSMVGTPEAAEEVAEHLAKDLKDRDPMLLAAALGMAVIAEGHAQAKVIRASLDSALEDLLGQFRTTGEVEQVANDHQPPAPAPTDLLPDDEPLGEPEGVSEAHTAAEGEKVWPEDRR